MKTFSACLGLSLCFACFACTPPEEEVHPKRRSAREDNLQRYLTKAHEMRALAQERAKPLVQGPLLAPDTLKRFLPQTPDLRVSAQIFSQKNRLETAVREASAREAAEKAGAILTQFRDEAVLAALSAQNPQELAAKLTEKTTLYSQKLTDFAHSQQETSWSVPNAQQSLVSKQELKESVLSLLEDITRDYGPKCGQKAKAVLQKTADDYWLVLSSVKQRQDLESELARVGSEADRAFGAVVAQYGDPVFSLSQEQAATLRADLIAAHQEVENRFEKLYGKEAVLKTRDIFEKYKKYADELVCIPARLSRMQEELNRAGESYRKEMAELQVQQNQELERRAALVRGIPLSVVGKKENGKQ